MNKRDFECSNQNRGEGKREVPKRTEPQVQSAETKSPLTGAFYVLRHVAFSLSVLNL